MAKKNACEYIAKLTHKAQSQDDDCPPYDIAITELHDRVCALEKRLGPPPPENLLRENLR
jgi:hypothetical protein